MKPRIDPISIQQLRRRHYTARVTYLDRVHDDLMILRVRPAGFRLAYEPGQYAVLGLGRWEPRAAGTQLERPDETAVGQVVKRAYSISSRLVDDQGRLPNRLADLDVEFFVTLIRRAAKPPALTPRLFTLNVGDTIFLGGRARGHYTLDRISPEDHVVFAATGTGEAPHNAMIVELLARGHRGAIACVTCVRHRNDLAYCSAHRRLERKFPNYHYLGVTTREPENIDRDHPDYVGKRYLQDLFQSNEIARLLGRELTPENTHVYLCGSPDMIGAPTPAEDRRGVYPKPLGMVELLARRGFRVDRPRAAGNIHFEKYW